MATPMPPVNTTQTATQGKGKGKRGKCIVFNGVCFGQALG